VLRPRPIRSDSNRNPFSTVPNPRGTRLCSSNTCAAVGHFCRLTAPGHIPNSQLEKCNLPRTDDTETTPQESKQRVSYHAISSVPKRSKAPLIDHVVFIRASLTRLANGGELCFRDRPGIGGIRSQGRIVDVRRRVAGHQSFRWFAGRRAAASCAPGGE
jgi:hypothetical protein